VELNKFELLEGIWHASGLPQNSKKGKKIYGKNSHFLERGRVNLRAAGADAKESAFSKRGSPRNLAVL
jgi:hypothetical protein